MRIAILMNMIAPYTTPVFEKLARRSDCDLFVIYETRMEPSRQWQAPPELPYQHTILRSMTLDLAWLAIGSGVKTRNDTYLYLPKRPLASLSRFHPHAVVAAGGGVWSSPTNIAALSARPRHGWGFVPWWGSFRRARPTLPRRLAEPWVRAFVRKGDAWMAYGTRAANELARLGADRSRIVIAPLVANASPEMVLTAEPRSASRRQMRYLFAGRLIETKGIDILIDAFRDVEGGELWIAGDGPLAELVEKAAKADERIRPLGHVDARELAKLYEGTDVLVLPSRHDVWGLVVNEAQTFGLPVIASDQVGAADDLIDPGVNGLIVPAGSSPALARAMTEIGGWSSAQRKRCVERSRATLAARSLNDAADAIFEACALAVEHRRARTQRRSLLPFS